MDQLPFELKAKIVNCLLTSEGLKLRQLNKGWEAIVDRHFKIRNVFISDAKKLAYKYYGSDEVVDCQFISGEKFSSSKINWSQSCFTNLKRLSVKIHFSTELKSEYLISQLDQLKQLEHLEFGGKYFNIEGKHSLRLPNLKYFETKRIHFFNTTMSNEPTILSMDTPKLQKLKLGCSSTIGHFKFVQPSSVQCLESSFFADEFVIFTNLKFLFFSLDDYQLDQIITRNFLKKLPSLQEVYTESECIFEQLSRQKKKFERSDLRLFLDGINLDNLGYLYFATDKFSQCKYCQWKKCEIQVLNHQSSITQDSKMRYGLCDILPFRTHINYSHLKANLNEGENLIDIKSSLSKLMKRFVNLKKISINVQDPDLLTMVLENCKKTLTKIRFRDLGSSYNHVWFKNLSNLCPYISVFILINSNIKNFYFLLGFKYLTELVLNNELEIYLRKKLEERGVKIEYRKHFCDNWTCRGECIPAPYINYDYEDEYNGNYYE